ncbi:helix-turn-helix domain-containing protein [Sphingobacterium lactis]|uniref:helix-turn-helix domain-containing protein n=1 Tax=Sphingobacterium lactis TaxID=797291 RepID=UPI003EC8DC55
MDSQITNPFQVLFDQMNAMNQKLDKVLTLQSPGGSGSIEWLNTDDAAKHCSTSVQTIRRLVKAGQIPYSKIGNKLRFKREDLDNYLLESA